MKVRVGSRGTIVIPKGVRKASGIKEGDLLEVSIKEEAIILMKDTIWERFHGCAKSLTSVEKIEKELDEGERDWQKRLER